MLYLFAEKLHKEDFLGRANVRKSLNPSMGSQIVDLENDKTNFASLLTKKYNHIGFIINLKAVFLLFNQKLQYCLEKYEKTFYLQII